MDILDEIDDLKQAVLDYISNASEEELEEFYEFCCEVFPDFPQKYQEEEKKLDAETKNENLKTKN